MRRKKLKLGQKAIYMASGPERSSGSTEAAKKAPEKSELSKELEQLARTLSPTAEKTNKQAKIRKFNVLADKINKKYSQNNKLKKNTDEMRHIVQLYLETGDNEHKILLDKKLKEISKQLDQLEVTKATKQAIAKAKVEVSPVRFSSKVDALSTEERQKYQPGAKLEVTVKRENLRTIGNAKKIVRKLKKGDKLTVTNDDRIIYVDDKNKERRLYVTVETESGQKGLILAKSTKVTQEAPTKKAVAAGDLEEIPTKNTPKEKEPTPEVGTAYTPETLQETPTQKMDRLSSALNSYKATKLRNKNLQNPNYLKDILKNDQLSDLQRGKIENSMNDLGVSFGQLSQMISENGNTLPLGTLIKATPLETESEMADLRKQFLISDDARELQTEIESLKKSNSPEDKIKLSQRQEEFRSKQEAYAQEGYAEFMDYYQKSPAYKSILKGYLKETEKLAQNPSEDAQFQFEARYKKLQRIYELASTLQTLDVRESTLITRDNIEDIDTSKAIPQIKSYAKQNASRLGLGTQRLAKIEQNLQSEAFGEEERNLYLTALLQLSTNQNIDELRRAAVIQGSKNKLTLHTENLTDMQKDKLILGLAHSESISQGFFDNLLDTDNLTETLNTLQNSKSFSDAKKIMYYHELKSVPDAQRGYTHLNQIFDRNYTGNLSKANDRYYTKTMEDSIGGSAIEVESTNVLRRFSSDLSQYQNILQEVEVNGMIDPKKLEAKFKELIKLGSLGVQLDEKLPDAQKKYLKRLVDGGLSISADDMKTGLSPAQLSLIRYGTVYEQLRNEFLKESPNSPTRKFEKAGLGGENLNPTMSALSTALQYIESGNIAVGGQTDAYEFGDGWKLTGSGSAGVYVLENPKVTLGGGITIQKKLDDKNTVSGSVGAGYGVGPNELTGGVNFDITLNSKATETLTTQLTVGGGLIIGGINVYVGGGLAKNNILKDKNERMASGLENMAERKLSREEVVYLKGLAQKPNLTPEDIANASKYFPGLKEAIAKDPGLKNLPQQKLEVFASNYIRTILTQIDNMSTEEAEGVNWNVALRAGVLLTPAPIPYIIPLVGAEWGGDTKVMKLYDNKNQLTEAQLKQQLRENLKAMPAGTNLEIVSESGYAANINGKEVVVKGANETIKNLEISNPVDKLNALRANTGIEFSQMRDSFLRAKIDDFQKLRQGLDAPNATRVNVYIDPALEKTFTLGHMSGIGEIGIKMKDGQIPDNLVILRESITTPSTSGGSTTEVKISFTTRENLLTGSDIENSSSLYDYISLNKYGVTQVNRDEQNLNFNRLKVNETLSFNKGFTREEANQLAEYSDDLISRSSIELKKNTHTPTEKLDKLIDKLLEKEGLLEDLAKLTVNRIENSKKITPKDREKAFKLIEAQAKEAGFNSLEASDYIYIYGNLLPDTFRPINELKPAERLKAIDKLATQYVEDYVRAFTKNTLKPNGERFTEKETQIIIRNLSEHSGVKDSFKASLMTPEVTLEGAGGSKNKLGLNGYELFTTANRRKVKGLRNSEITSVFENQIVKGSLTKFDANTIKNPEERNIVNQFLHSMSEQVPAVDTNDFTMENLRNPEFKEKIKQVLNSRTALQLMSTTPFSSEGKKVSLLGVMYGPEKLMLIENFYNRMDKSGSAPTEFLIKEGPMKEAISNLINDIQEIDRSQGVVNRKTYKGDNLKINIKEESGVVLIGKCANPTYIYQRKLSAKLDVKSTAPAAAKANASRVYKLGKATRENMNRIGFATKLSFQPETPRKTGEEIPSGGGGEEPRKTGEEIPTTSEPDSTPIDTSRSSRADRAQRRNNQ